MVHTTNQSVIETQFLSMSRFWNRKAYMAEMEAPSLRDAFSSCSSSGVS